MKFFSADFHGYHEKILASGFGKRPWNTIEDMTQALVDNFNSKVSADDELYILGDLFFKPNQRKDDIIKTVASLKCKNIFITPGNHDKKSQLIDFGFKEANIADSFEVVLFGIRFKCQHFQFVEFMTDKDARERPHLPFVRRATWEDTNEQIKLLSGHVHESWKLRPNNLNVGVDVFNYFPVSEDEIFDIFQDTNGFTGNFEKYNLGFGTGHE
jgi:calcineurin-like phosphoesterase family protein